jgi:hypothetical protein
LRTFLTTSHENEAFGVKILAYPKKAYIFKVILK